jgi:hypothetical protein
MCGIETTQSGPERKPCDRTLIARWDVFRPSGGMRLNDLPSVLVGSLAILSRGSSVLLRPWRKSAILIGVLCRLLIGEWGKR